MPKGSCTWKANSFSSPPANEVCEGYVFTPVCQSFYSQGGLSHCMLRYPLPTQGPEAGTPQEQTPLAQCMLGDTGNKRAVRILLECNIVFFEFCYCPIFSWILCEPIWKRCRCHFCFRANINECKPKIEIAFSWLFREFNVLLTLSGGKDNQICAFDFVF